MTEIPDIPGRVEERLAEWRSAVSTTMFEPVADVLRQASDVAEHSGPVDDVIEPVRNILVETDICAGLPLSLLETLHELRTRATHVQESISRVEDESLFSPTESDHLFVRLRKAIVLGSRRLSGRQTDPPREHTVALRDLALYHVIERAGAAEIQATLKRRDRIAASLARLERSLSDLCHTSLAAASDGGTGGGDSDTEQAASAAAARLREAADELQPLSPLNLDPDEWQEDIRTSGSFLAPDRTLDDEDVRRRLTTLTHHAQAWADWQQQMTERLAFCERLIAVRQELGASDRSIRLRLSDKLHRPAEALDGFARIIREAESDVPSDALARQTLEASAWLAETESHLLDTLDRSVVQPIPPEKLTTDLKQAIASLRSDAERLSERFGSDFRMHPIPDPDAKSVDPRVEPVEVDLGEILRQGLGPILGDSFEKRTTDAIFPLLEILGEAPELREVIRYNLRAADARAREEDEAELHPTDVVQTGLSRAADSAAQMADRIREHSRQVDSAISSVAGEAWTRIHERARVQRQMHGAVIDLQREVDVQIRKVSDRARSTWTRLSSNVRRSSLRSVVLARRVLRRGQAAVGAGSVAESGYHDTAQALSGLGEILEQVPAIYRRLFSFAPVSEPELLVGREQDLGFLKRHVALWDVGVPQALILHGNPSSGRTSLLNVFIQDVREDHSIVHVKIPPTVSSERELLSVLSASDGFDIDGVETLAELGDHILEQQRSPAARICIVEQLGGLMTRTIGGFDLIAEFIALMSRTDSRWLWIATMSESGWKTLQSARPEAAALALSRTLDPIDRRELEQLVMQRHQRSGVPLEFLEPRDPSPLLRRRLRSVRNPEGRQKILREAWFDRLFAVAGEDIMMALFYWIRSVEMTESEDRLRVRWFRPIRFDFLSAFSMDQAFALKAILERGTLSVEQHAETNLLSLIESRRILESLGNAMLIEPIADGGSATRFDSSSIRDDASYRIRPLVIHPVIRFLQGRNIVH